MTRSPSDSRLHVLFLNTQDSLRADVSVHVSLARALDRAQARVSVATSAYETPGDSARDAFASISDLRLLQPALGRPYSTQSGLKRMLALAHNVSGVASLVSLAAWCRRERVDVVHVTERPRDAAFGTLLARMAGAACLIHAHTSYYSRAPSPAARLADWTLRHADAVVGVSEFTAATFRHPGPVPDEHVFAVHNAVDSTVLQAQPSPDVRAEMRAQLGIAPQVPVVGTAGRLMRGKNQVSLVEAFVDVRKAVPNARLVIAGRSADLAPDGRGDYGDYLRRRVQELCLTDAVCFTGLLPHHSMARLFGAFDLFVHPCVGEPFGLVVVEAMATRRPVIAVNAGGIPEIIRDGVDGLLVPPHQSAALTTAIVDLLADPARADRLACAGRQRVLSAFTPEIQATAMLKVYRQIARR